MEFIDSHSHLFASEFDMDRLQTVERAVNEGVSKMILPNIDKDTIEPMLELCNAFPQHCYPTIGLHPTSVKDDYPDQLKVIDKYLGSHLFKAIGEVGIDLYWDKTYFRQQCEAFSYQIALARKHALPLVIHSRDSFAEILEVLREHHQGASYSGVFHSFSGNEEQAGEAIALGFKIGINGIVTFKNASLAAVVKEIPLENILLETDSPYLAPVPKRGKRNESAYIPLIAVKIAEIKGIAIDEVAEVTTQTTKTLFKL